MPKPHVIVIIVISGLVIGIVALLVISSQQPAQKQSETKIIPTVQKIKPDLKYVDESGFEFTYSPDLTVKPSEKLLDTQYSEINITSVKRKGNININIEAATTSDFSEWEKENKINIKTNPAKDLKIADLSAKQYLIDKKTITVSFDQGVIFTITLDPADNPAYWITNYNKIVSSFKIALPQQEEVDTSGASDQTIDGGVEYEGEEVIE